MLSSTKQKAKNLQSEPNEVTGVFGFLIYNIFVEFGGRQIFQQIIGRTLWKQAVPLSLWIFSYTHIKQSLYNNPLINNPNFPDWILLIYIKGLEIKDTTVTASSAFLVFTRNLTLMIKSDFMTKETTSIWPL